MSVGTLKTYLVPGTVFVFALETSYFVPPVEILKVTGSVLVAVSNRLLMLRDVAC